MPFVLIRQSEIPGNLLRKELCPPPATVQNWAGPLTCTIDLLSAPLIRLPDTPNYCFAAAKDSRSLNQPFTLLLASGPGQGLPLIFPFPFMMYMAPRRSGTFYLNEFILLGLPYRPLSFAGVAAFIVVRSWSPSCSIAGQLGTGARAGGEEP